jgi:predicted cupin superfamily sugar epimerase
MWARRNVVSWAFCVGPTTTPRKNLLLRKHGGGDYPTEGFRTSEQEKKGMSKTVSNSMKLWSYIIMAKSVVKYIFHRTKSLKLQVCVSV